MGRQPEVFVEELAPEQAQRLVKVSRTAKHHMRLRRAGIVLASLQSRTVDEIVEMFAASDHHVRDVFHAFNERGFGRWTHNGEGAGW